MKVFDETIPGFFFIFCLRDNERFDYPLVFVSFMACVSTHLCLLMALFGLDFPHLLYRGHWETAAHPFYGQLFVW